MAESQLLCMDEDHVNEKIPESKAEFYYCEEQRAALEQLLKNGDGAFKMRLKEDNVRDFLSAREIKWIRKTLDEYDSDSESEKGEYEKAQESNADSGVHSTYWPQMSDTDVPPLDIGWPGSTSFYKGVTRVSVHTHPPKNKGPHIKEVVRRLIQESNKVVAVVMDHLTDLQILQDLLDAAQRRGVAVYIILEARGMPHFLDMCTRLQITALHLRNLRVRTVKGSGLALSFGRLPGSLCSKYMLVDGEKVMFGSYSFTWSSSRMDRNTITVMSGQVVDFFDNDFREMYAVSENVDLYKEFHITKPPMPAPVRKVVVPKPLLISTSRFQVSLGDSRGQADQRVPAHKYHNPKYSLVVGNSLGLTGSLQDLSTLRDSLGGGLERNGLSTLLHAKGGSSVELDMVTVKSPSSPVEDEEDGKGGSLKRQVLGGKKQRSSFRLFLKGRGSNHNSETIEEDGATPSNPSSTRPNPSPSRPTPTPSHPTPSPSCPTPSLAHRTPSPTHPTLSPTRPNPSPTHLTPSPTRSNPSATQQNPSSTHSTPSPTHPTLSPTHPNPSPTHSTPSPTRPNPSSTRKVSETNSTATGDSFEMVEKPSLLKFKNKKPSKLPQRSMSLMTLNKGEDGGKGHKKPSKRNCIQS
ncbi:protein FAM83F [Oncorhynchus kisutch]|uniref:Family with sequence similarity 83 member Fa n=1 Tax=Oncorhynchus kisutch TaxID=8019 RepID=A0A8C7CBY3_ONCKI|nr:protein FAM83F [Oncorhynchus kisutch]